MLWMLWTMNLGFTASPTDAVNPTAPSAGTTFDRKAPSDETYPRQAQTDGSYPRKAPSDDTYPRQARE